MTSGRQWELGGARQGYGRPPGRAAKLPRQWDQQPDGVALAAWDSTNDARINYVNISISSHGTHRRFILDMIGGNLAKLDKSIM